LVYEIEDAGIDKESEALLSNYIEPELYNDNAFMNMRACSVIHKFMKDDFSPVFLKKLATGVCKCMGNGNLAVRFSAAKALERLLQQKDLKDHFLPNLKDILIQYLNLANEYESDLLIDS